MSTPTTRMWEARVRAGMVDETVRWVIEVVLSSARDAGATSVEVCYALEPTPRVVVITRWPTATDWSEPGADDRLVARSHGWSFRAVDIDATLARSTADGSVGLD